MDTSLSLSLQCLAFICRECTIIFRMTPEATLPYASRVSTSSEQTIIAGNRHMTEQPIKGKIWPGMQCSGRAEYSIQYDYVSHLDIDGVTWTQPL